MTQLEILQTALNVYGIDKQRVMLIDEVGKLLNAIGKQPRGRATNDDILEGLADVVILCEQVAISISFVEYRTKRLEKLERLEATLSKHSLNQL